MCTIANIEGVDEEVLDTEQGDGVVDVEAEHEGLDEVDRLLDGAYVLCLRRSLHKNQSIQ